ncbi:hypothetical protein LXA43DRAFT_1097885 [Ganoderma leucocontextum]|nr:hypothetical protein LXA43DRAFT_1097885 [Ganoderma leucocontextum]
MPSVFGSSSATLSGTDSVVIDTGDSGLRVYRLYNSPSSTFTSRPATSVDFLRTLEQSVVKNLTTSPILLSKAMVIWGTDLGEVAIWNTRTGRLEASFQVQPGTSITSIGVLPLSTKNIVLTDGNLTVRVVTGSKLGLQISSLQLKLLEGDDIGISEQGSKLSTSSETLVQGVHSPHIGHTDYLFFLWARTLNLLLLSVLLTMFVREYEFILVL